MIVIRNNMVCDPREHLSLEHYIRKQSLSNVIVVPEYCEVLCVCEGDQNILLVDQDGNQIKTLQRGRWIAQEDYPGEYAKCSLCGCRCQGYVPNYKYCPNCGAKMDLE